MNKYVLIGVQQIAQLVALFFVVSVFCFYLISWLPSDSVSLLVQNNPNISYEQINRLRELYGLGLPVYERYLNWVSQIVNLDFGYSRIYKTDAYLVLMPSIRNTFWLSMVSFCLAGVIGSFLGFSSAIRKHSIFSKLELCLSFLSLSTPVYLVSLGLMYFFSVQIGWLPPTEAYNYKHLLMPVLTLILVQTGAIYQYSRLVMEGILKHKYILAAKAKGVSEKNLVFKHGYRNIYRSHCSFLIVTFIEFFSGSLVVETVFEFHGVGYLMYQSLLFEDYVTFVPSVLLVLFFAFFLMSVKKMFLVVVDGPVGNKGSV